MINYTAKIDKYKSYDILNADRERRGTMQAHFELGGINVGECNR